MKERRSNQCPNCGAVAAMRAARVRIVNGECVCDLTCWHCNARWSVPMPDPATAEVRA